MNETENKHCNIVVRIEGNPVAEGKTVTDMLNYIPGVHSRNRQVTINGLGGTEVYIGKRKSTIATSTSLRNYKDLDGYVDAYVNNYVSSG